ncbi:MAG: DVUA0089 family protein, partial [Pirellula sp.]
MCESNPFHWNSLLDRAGFHARKAELRRRWKHLLRFEVLEKRLARADLDDSISEALMLGALAVTPRTVGASISPDTDVNMVGFTVSAGQVVDFDIDTPFNGPQGLGTYIRLFNQFGQQLAANNDGSAPGENVLGFDSYFRYAFADAGTYFLGVSNFNNVQYNAVSGDGDTSGGLYATGDYILTLQALPVDLDDAISEALQLGGITSTAKTLTANLVMDIDVNMVGFSVIAGQTVDFDIDTTANGVGGLGSFIRLFNAQGQQLAFNNDGVAPGENTLGFDSYLRYTFAAANTYYLGVSNFNNTQYNPLNGNGDAEGGLYSIGSYQLILQTAPVVLPDSNDTIQEAISLGTVSTTPITTSATLSPDVDVNVYSFSVGTGQVVDFDIDTLLNGSGGLGSYLRLFDASGTQLAFNNDGSAPGENSVGFDAYLRHTFASAGTFFIGVSNFNNTQYNPITGEGDVAGGSNTVGAYQLILQALPIDTNDILTEAAHLGVITATPSVVNASIITDIDVNIVAFSISSGQIVDFDIDTTLNGAGGLGSYIRLFNSQGQVLAFNNDAAAPGESTIGFDAYLRYTFATGGTYYLGTSNYNNIQYDPINGTGDTPGGMNSIGSYQLSIQTAPTVVSDLNDTISEAIALGAASITPSTVSANLSPDTDVNMYSFSVTAGQVVDFDIDTTLNGTGGLGSYLRLFNSTGVQLSFNNDGAAPGENTVGFDAYLRYSFSSAGTYFVAVSNFNNIQYDPISGNGDVSGGANATGTYQLTVLALPTDTNDSLGEASQLGAITSTPTVVNSTIVTDVDVNMVAFNVSNGQVVDFDIDTPSNGPGGLGSFIRLFNAQGQLLAFNNDATAPGENLLGFDAYLRYTFATGGTYFLGVSNLNNIQYNPVTGDGDAAGGLHSIGVYQLTIQTAPASVLDLNDSMVEADILGPISTTPISVSANISPDTDVNLYRFTVTAGQVVDFDIDTSLNGSSGLGSYLRLFDSSGVQLAFNNDAAAPGENSVGFDAYLRFTFQSAGTYFIGVSNFNNIQYDAVTGNGDTSGGANATGAYQLIVQALPIDTNDSIAEATLLGAVTSTPTVVNASILTDIDVNIVAFTITAGQSVDFDIDTTSNGPGGLGSYIRLFNSQGQVQAFNNDAAAPDENTIGFDAYLRFTFLVSGTYYLGVSNFNNAQYDPLSGNGDTPGGQHSIGSYQLIIQSAPVVTSDLNDTISEAVSLGSISVSPNTTSGSISPDIDVNMYKFTVTAGQVVDFDIDTTLNGAGGLGSYLRLFDSTGTQLAFNNNAAAPGENTVGFDAYLRTTFQAAGTYYIGVSNSNNTQYDPVAGNGDTPGGPNSTGAYQLIVQALPIDNNDSIGEATLLGAISPTPTTVNSSIVTDIDVNMVAFTVSAGQVVDIDVDTSLNGAGGLQSFVRLFDVQGQVLAFNNDAAAPGENIIGFDAYLRYTFATSGTYYLGLSNFNNTQYDPMTGNGDTPGGQYSIGNYQLILQTAPVAVSDVDDSIAEAVSIGAISTIPAVIAASISPDTDVNMVRFVVTAGQIVDFDIDTALNGGSGLGSYLRLFDGQGAQLALNNDAAAPGENSIGLDAYLRFVFPNSGTFYIGVSNSNNTQYDPVTGNGDVSGGANSTGAYQLILNALPSDNDDTIAEASPLGAITSSPAIVNGSIITDIDVNMVGFSVTAGQVVDFDIDTTNNGPGGLGSFVRLFDSQGAELAFNNDAAAPGEGTVGFDAYLRFTFAQAGNYYIGVSNANNFSYNPTTGNGDTAGGFHSVGAYQLIINSASMGNPEDTNDAIQEAVSLGLITTIATTVSSNLSVDTDVNLYGFTVSAGQLIDFDIDTSFNGPGGLGSYLRLFNAQGSELAFNNDGAAPGENFVGFDAYLRKSFATAGNYFVGISNYNNTQYDALTGNGDTVGGSNTTGNYQLSIQAIPVDLNDALSEATSLGAVTNIPTTVSASIATDIDVNMVAFSVIAGQIVDFDIDTNSNGPEGLDSFIRLFNASGQQLAFNSDASAVGENSVGFDAYLRYTFAVGGTYYLGVSNANNALYDPLTGNSDTQGGFYSIGNYQLTVQTASIALADLNDAISEAASLGAVLATPTVISASISPDTDVNMLGFNVVAGQ